MSNWMDRFKNSPSLYLKLFAMLGIFIMLATVVLTSVMGTESIAGIRQFLDANTDGFFSNAFAGYLRGYNGTLMFLVLFSMACLIAEQYLEG